MSLAVSRVSVATDVDVPRSITRQVRTKQVVRTRKIAFAKVTPKAQTPNIQIVATAVVVSLGILGAFNLSNGMFPPNGMRLEKSHDSSYPISLDSATSVRKLGYLSISGNAVNDSRTNLSHIEAVVELLDAKNHILATESSLIESNSFISGQAAPFQVEVSDNPKAIAYRVRFRQMSGFGR